MKTLHCLSLGWLAVLIPTLGLAGTAVAADTHVIVGTHTPNFKPIWKSGDKQSNGPAQPLILEVKKGDVVQVDVNDSSMPHGIVTIDKKGTDQPAPVFEVVQACNEDKPDAVLKEIECTGDSNFGKLFEGTMKLEVLDKFQEDLHFWCVQHKQVMWGTLKLKP